MTQSIRIRRDGDRIVIDDVLTSTEYAGVLKSASLDAEAAVELFFAGLLLAREILRERNRRS